MGSRSRMHVPADRPEPNATLRRAAGRADYSVPLLSRVAPSTLAAHVGARENVLTTLLPLAVPACLTMNPLFLSGRRQPPSRCAVVNLHAQQRLARDWRRACGSRSVRQGLPAGGGYNLGGRRSCSCPTSCRAGAPVIQHFLAGPHWSTALLGMGLLRPPQARLTALRCTRSTTIPRPGQSRPSRARITNGRPVPRRARRAAGRRDSPPNHRLHRRGRTAALANHLQARLHARGSAFRLSAAMRRTAGKDRCWQCDGAGRAHGTRVTVPATLSSIRMR